MTTARKTAHTVINTTRVYGQHSFSSVNIFTAISGTAGTIHSVAIACISNQISLQSHILLQLIRSNVSNGRPQFQRNRSGPDLACGLRISCLRISSGWPKGRETARRPAPRAVFERLTQRHQQQQQLSAQTNVATAAVDGRACSDNSCGVSNDKARVCGRRVLWDLASKL